jgi:hypothetical protein
MSGGPGACLPLARDAWEQQGGTPGRPAGGAGGHSRQVHMVKSRREAAYFCQADTRMMT